jgi:hypothetical protein
VSQISSVFTPQLQLILTLIFTFFSFSLTITTGLIKVFQIHENLEKNIQIRQEWASFIISISTELQLPIEERQDALKLIRDNKNIYLSLLNKDIESDKIDTKITLSSTISDLKRKLKKIEEDKYKRGKESILYESLAIKRHIELLNNIGVSISDITTGIVQDEMKSIYFRGLTSNNNNYNSNYINYNDNDNDSDDGNNSVINFSIREAIRNNHQHPFSINMDDNMTPIRMSE